MVAELLASHLDNMRGVNEAILLEARGGEVRVFHTNREAVARVALTRDWKAPERAAMADLDDQPRPLIAAMTPIHNGVEYVKQRHGTSEVWLWPDERAGHMGNRFG